MVYRILVLLGLIFGFYSCNDGEACTEDFRTVIITVSGDPLSEAYTIRKDTDEKLNFNHQNALGAESYIVVDDTYVEKMKNQTLDFLFVGVLSGTVVVEEEFTIRADECHVEYVSGNTDVVI